MATLRKIHLIAQQPGFDLAQPTGFDYDQRVISLSYIDATPTGLCCAFGTGFLLRCHPDGAGPSIQKWNKPLKNQNLRNLLSSYMILEWLSFSYAQPPCFFWPYKRRSPTGLDLINLKLTLNGYKLKAGSIFYISYFLSCF